MYVCLCRGLKERDVRQAAREGHTTAEALVARLELDDPSCCGRCARNIRQFVLLALDECAKPAAEASG
jgi:bacterioferritin-associated ferredoxin